MNDDRGSVEKRKLNGDKVAVPTWVMAVTYILCWCFGAAIIVIQLLGHVAYRPILIGTAIYLILWPVFQVSPAEMIRKLFPSG